MALYTYVVADVRTGIVKEEIPFSGVKWSRILNGAGGFSATIRSRHPKATKTNLDPARTFLYVLRGDVVVWAGIIWSVRQVDGVLNIAGLSIWSYFRRRNIRHTLTYTATNQLAIIRDILDYAQDQPGGDIGLVIGSETGGPARDRTYPAYERKPVAEAIEQMADNIDGFDFSIETTLSGSTFTNTFVPWYPRRGRRSNNVWEVGVHCDVNDWELDGTKTANLMDALGEGDGDTMLIAAAADTALLETYPLLEDTVSYRDISVPENLAAKANTWLTNRRLPIAAVDVSLKQTRDTQVGSFIEGDEVQVRGSDGWVELDSWYRVISFEVTVTDEGDESIAVKFKGAEAME